MTAYEPDYTYIGEGEYETLACENCGALIAAVSIKQHNAWHLALYAALTLALPRADA